MKPLIAGAALVAILLLRKKKDVLKDVKDKSTPDIIALQNQYSVTENLTQAVEFASYGAGIGATLGGPIGLVVGAAVGWAAGLIALALRGGVRMGLEIRRIVRSKYREMGFPKQADEFLLFATMLGATSRALGIGSDGNLYVPISGNHAIDWPASFDRTSLESYMDTFWGVLTGYERNTPELNAIIARLARPNWPPIDAPVIHKLSLVPGKWRGTDEGQSLEDVPYLNSMNPRLDVPWGGKLVYFGRLAESPLAYKVALKWAAKKFGVSNEPWCISAIEQITGGDA